MPYSEIRAYFNTQRDNITTLEKIFQLFLKAPLFPMSNETLNAEIIIPGRVFPITQQNGPSISGVDLLKQKRDARNIPVLTYALAGKCSEENFRWLLETLDATTIQTYSALTWSLVAIAATYGSQQRLELLLQDYYRPTENELLQGLFFAVYHGHLNLYHFILSKINQIRVQQNQEKLVPETLRDNEQNTLLHVAILGGDPESIDFFAKSSSHNHLELKNSDQKRAIDEAVLSGNQALVNQISYFYTALKRDIDYSDLIILLIKKNSFSDIEKEMLQHLRKQHPNDLESQEKWIKEAIDIDNEAVANEIILGLPNAFDVSALLTYATKKNDPNSNIAFILSAELQTRQWIDNIFENIFGRLRAYILRDSSQLDQLAQEDHLPKGSYFLSTTMFKKNRLTTCEQFLQTFFYQDFYKKLKEIYHKLPTNNRSADAFYNIITLQRSELTKKIKKNDATGFKQQLEQAVVTAARILTPDLHALQTGDYPLPNISSLSSAIDDNGSDTGLRSFSAKQTHFINVFAEEFDKTYNFYKSLCDGDVIRKPDTMNQLAEAVKTAAIAALPNINVSAPMFGIPLPFSISLPSGVAIAAVIDFMLFISRQIGQTQQNRIGHFFEGTTLRDRVDAIYDCAEFLAERFCDQIELLSHSDSIPRLANMAVARIFRHAMGANAHIQKRNRSSAGTFFRYLVSPVYNTPDPGTIRKTLIEVSINALSRYEHNIFFLNREEEKFLRPDEQLSSQRKPVDWTVKGIFEHTGIRANGKIYRGDRQEVNRYGYIHATQEEAEKRGMKQSSASDSQANLKLPSNSYFK